MRKARMQAAQSVADELTPAETVIDEALARVASLTCAMATARVEASLSPMCREAAFVRVYAASALLFEARSALLDTNRELAVTQKEIGLHEVSFGDLMGCPPMKSDAGTNVVAIAA